MAARISTGEYDSPFDTVEMKCSAMPLVSIPSYPHWGLLGVDQTALFQQAGVATAGTLTEKRGGASMAVG
ncbi:hypothetical protein EYF80_031179 [Liparis tanakae]|uniref:Uncharacterized protein n=1 Tax=Liparis tanakae TaxID=230148 RepID=A0A4Z2GYM7_9TELE|nr:hypothetical protein EYF80_031179 [Liparis tanakae]